MKRFFEHYGFGILAVVAITVLLFCIPPVRNTIFNTASGLINRFRGTAVEKVDKVDGLQYGAILTNNRAVLNVESTTDKFDTKIHYIYNGIEYVVDGKQLDAAGSNSIIVDDILVSKDDVLLYPDMNSKYYVEFINQGTGEVIVSDKEKFKGRDTIINEDTFNLVFNSNGGSDVSTLNTSRVPLNLPKPTRAGYKFSGWYTDALLTNPAVSGTKLTADTTLYAKWTNTSHTVSFNSNGGSAVTSMTVGEGDQFGTLPTPTKTGYTFIGWYNSSGAKISSTSVMGNADITLNARWTEKNIRYDIVYKSLSGVQLGSGTQTEKFNTSKVVVPGNIVGYTTPASQTVVWDTEATKTITFTYTPITYNIHYNLDGGTLETPKNTYNVEDVFTIGTPHKDGYEFAGWFDNSLLTGTAITKISQATGNKTLYAKWESLNYYWGIDGSNKLIISDKEVTTATGGRSGSFSTTANYLDDDPPWYPFASDITSAEVIKVNKKVAPVSTSSWFAGLENATSIDVSDLDTSNVTNMEGMFANAGYNTTTFTITGLESWDTSKVTIMCGMFAGAGFNATTWSIGDISNWNTSKVTDMSNMFSYAGHNATTFNLNLSNWNTSNVIDMSYMFAGAGFNATTFNLDLSSWDTSNVTDMSWMFYNAGRKTTTFSLDLSSWNTSNVTNMDRMFSITGRDATSWSIGDLSNWDTSSVTNMYYMFYYAGYSASTWSVGDLSGWDTVKVTNMERMFSYAGYNSVTFSMNLSNWDTSKVTSMSGMFSGSGYNAATWSIGNLGIWDISNVTKMSSMFYGAGYKATIWNIGDIGNWNTGNVTGMSYMFANAGHNATIWSIGDISNWNTSKVTNMSGMFSGVGNNATAWNIGDLSTKTVTVNGNTYTAWDVSNVTDMSSMFNGTGFNITAFDVGNIGNWNVTKVTDMSFMFGAAGHNATKWSVGDLSNWDTGGVTNMSRMFASAGYNAITWNIGDISNWNTSKVTNMSEMFISAGRNVITELDLSGWDATNVTNMSQMFLGINSLETIKTPKNIQTGTNTTGITSKKFYDITDNNKEYAAGTFPTGNGSTSHTLTSVDPNYYWGIDSTNKLIISDAPVTTATDSRSGSFAKTATFSITGSGTSTATTAPWGAYADTITDIKVTKVNKNVSPSSTAYWFAGLTNVTSIDVTNLDTSNVTDMSYMFCEAGASATTFSITGLDSWNTSKVTDMSSMFMATGTNATSWSIGDISNWNTSNVTNMSQMFFFASDAITELDLSGWDASKVTDMSMMFCTIDSLETIKTPKNIQDSINLTDITGKTFYDTTNNSTEYAAGTFPVGNTESHTLVSDINIYWRVDGSKLTISDKPIDDVTTYIAMPYGSFAATETFNPTAGNPAPWYDFRKSITSVEVVEVNRKVAPVSTAYWFARMYNVETVDLSNLDAANVTSMSFMFDNTNARIIKTPINIRSDLNTENILSAVYRDITDNNIEYDNLSFPIGNGNVSHTLEFVEGINN